jgi:hypothetical protein
MVLKIDNILIYFFILKMQLKMNTVYAVDTQYETFIGTYRGQVSNNYMRFKNILWDVKVRIKNKSDVNSHVKRSPILVQYVSINNYDNVYDLDKIKDNAKKAKEQMEKRALDIVLKGLVNEHFQWF